MTELISDMAASQAGPTKDAAYRQIELIEKLITKTQPENIHHPEIGVYSHPEGNVAHPTAELKCRFLWIGYDLRPETLTPLEIDLLNRLVPGEYRVTKADGTGIPFRIRAKESDRLDSAGKPAIEELSIWFPCTGDHRQNHLSMVDYMRQALGDKLPTSAEMLKEIAKLRAELARERQQALARG